MEWTDASTAGKETEQEASYSSRDEARMAETPPVATPPFGIPNTTHVLMIVVAVRRRLRDRQDVVLGHSSVVLSSAVKTSRSAEQ